jgi:uncharacterized membrane protein YozB (DUF420 family)
MVKSNLISHVKMIVYTIVIILYLVYSVGQIDSLLPIVSSLSMVAIVISIPQASPLTKCFSLLFLLTGSFFVLREGIGVSEYVGLFGEMLSLLSLLQSFQYWQYLFK